MCRFPIVLVVPGWCSACRLLQPMPEGSGKHLTLILASEVEALDYVQSCRTTSISSYLVFYLLEVVAKPVEGRDVELHQQACEWRQAVHTDAQMPECAFTAAYMKC